ncbi:MAG: CvpA family protein [Parasporobacterium sp.]|nr:CvpA family protein [Parasporobacterium sp.]
MSTAALIATIAVIVLLAVFVIVGFARGLLRILVTTFSLVITIVVAALLTVPVGNLLQEKTFVGTEVTKGVEGYIDGKISVDTKKVLETDPNEFIDGLFLPKFIKDDLKESNTITKYNALGVKNFKEYIVKQLVGLIVRLITFILLLIIVYLLTRLLLAISKLIEKIPVINGINRVFGGLIGLIEGALIVWILCSIVMALASTALGETIVKVIRESAFLSFVYDNNMLIVLLRSVFTIG